MNFFRLRVDPISRYDALPSPKDLPPSLGLFFVVKTRTTISEEADTMPCTKLSIPSAWSMSSFVEAHLRKSALIAGLLLSVTQGWCAGGPGPGSDARSPLPNAGRSNISMALSPIAQLAELTASDGAAGNAIGTAVAISGNAVVVGAPDETINGNTYQGAAYVFVKPANGWSNLTQVAKLTASDNSQLFGAAVAISGDTIAVGAPWSNNFGGTVYVFTKPSSGWADMTQTAEFSSPGGLYDGFGYFVGISGDTIVSSGPGPAYVFVRPAIVLDDMAPTAELSDNTGAYGNGGVAISGNTIVVGLNGCCDDNGFVYPGQVDVFVKPAAGWVIAPPPSAVLTGTDETEEDFFGLSVAISGGTVVTGAPYHQFHTGNDGAAYVFLKPAGGWTNMSQTARLSASSTVQLGYSVAISGGLVLVGDHLTGSAYLFAVPSSGWKTTTHTVAQFSGASTDYQGISLQGRTIVIGSPGTSVNGTVEGAAFVY